MSATGRKRPSEHASHSDHPVRIIIAYADRRLRGTDHESSRQLEHSGMFCEF